MGEVHAISIQCGGARSTRATMLQIDGVGGLDVRRIILRRVERRWPRAVTVVALADTTTVQQRLAVAFRLATFGTRFRCVPYLACSPRTARCALTT